LGIISRIAASEAGPFTVHFWYVPWEVCLILFPFWFVTSCDLMWRDVILFYFRITCTSPHHSKCHT
jgi:hypothetical protein